MTSEANTTSTTAPAKRVSPPPPEDLSRPNAGQPPAKRARDNKFDPTVLPKTSDAEEILKQVEFYFSDANLPRDKYLWTLTQSDPKKEGWVPIKNIASFKRMQRFQPVESISSALRASKDLLEVNEDGTMVRRKVPLVRLSQETFTELGQRTVYAKGFGDETPTLQIDLEKYFGEFGEIESLRLRRTETGLFKGSVFVQFKNKEDADKYLAEPQEWKGSLLDAKTKSAYIQQKKEEDEKLTWDERRERDAKREREKRGQKHFSAFKEMEKTNKQSQRRGNRREERGQGRRGRDGRGRDRSRSPRPAEETPAASAEVKAAASEKRPREESPTEAAPSLFNNKREKLDPVEAEEAQNGKRGADEELQGDAKKAKVDGQ